MAILNSQHLRDYPARPDKVYLYGTCLADTLFPESGMDAITLLEQQGIEVLFPMGQTCCGQPAYNSGYEQEARKVALAQIKQFPLEIPIVIISGSCGGMMRHHYADLLRDEPGIEDFCNRIFEFTEFLVHVLKIKLQDKGASEKVALHTSCAARREMGVHITGRALLSQLENVTLITHENESECCGFGGTFAVKHADISAAMVADKTQSLLEADVVRYVTADNGCRMNINGSLEYQKQSLRGEHIASYLLSRVTGGTDGEPS
ncbi:(Fe-S)-binding protein [Alteromonas aestuariivivens]|uniref:(Fe-S)-binding protein n=1 Tax=Alteromonas aestuariivivens TaxID=1938339 RepID=A0A3D8M6X4_9ALTE|nr:(Fe-S)-binding protein [Alteromonas aestuariivivens]RDV25455.1 (Fe-S)-binding protein [Alteromonas aestuariivivens]